MPASSPRRAVDAARDRLRRIGVCLTDRPIIATGARPSPASQRFAFVPVDRPVPLRAADGARGVALAMALDYVVEPSSETGRFAVWTTAYRFDIDDVDGREILAYHWHPISVSPVTFPHMHLSSQIGRIVLGPRFDPVALGEMHLPTGFITLADVVRLLIAEFGVAPRRADWEAILRDADDALRADEVGEAR